LSRGERLALGLNALRFGRSSCGGSLAFLCSAVRPHDGRLSASAGDGQINKSAKLFLNLSLRRKFMGAAPGLNLSKYQSGLRAIVATGEAATRFRRQVIGSQ
jgi:hypothetical protein